MKGEPTVGKLIPVRCPFCHRLAAEISAGAQLRVKCSRCREFFEVRGVVPRASSEASDE